VLARKTFVGLIAIWTTSTYVKIFVLICVVVDSFWEIFEEVLLHARNIAIVVNHNHIVSDVLKLFEVDLGILAN
jgi:hypothetical protein